MHQQERPRPVRPPVNHFATLPLFDRSETRHIDREFCERDWDVEFPRMAWQYRGWKQLPWKYPRYCQAIRGKSESFERMESHWEKLAKNGLPEKYLEDGSPLDFRVLFVVLQMFENTTAAGYMAWFN